MKILKVELENITSHAQTKIDLKDGVNVLTGLNGSGKSTTVKMIGLDVFGFSPSRNFKIFVRNNNPSSSAGTIKVFIETRDGKKYVIYRQIGSKSQHSVYALEDDLLFDDEHGEEITHSTEETLSWVRKEFKLDETYDLAAIFENAVGVEQGKFTSPFLSTSLKEKKALFGAMLNVEVYETIYENFRSIMSSIDSKINHSTETIKVLEGKSENKPKLLQEADKITKELKILEKDLQQYKAEIQTVKQEYEEMEKTKTRIEDLHKQNQILLQKIDGFKSLKNKITVQIEEAQKAKKICDATKSKYDQHIALKEKEKDLAEKSIKLTELNKQLSTVNQHIIKLETDLQNNTLRIEEITKDRIEEANLREKKRELDKVETELDQIKSNLAQIQTKKKDIAKEKNDLAAKEKTHDQLGEQVKILPVLEKEIGQIDMLQENFNQVSGEVKQLEAKLQQHEENKTKSLNGKCPFLNEQCKNIKEDNLDAYFDNQIAAIEPQIAEKQQLIQEIDKKIKQLKKQQDKYNELSKKKATLDAISEEIAGIKENIALIQAFIQDAPTIEKKKADLEKIKVQLIPFADKLAALEEKLQTLKILEKQKLTLAKSLAVPKAKLTTINSDIQELQYVPDAYKKTREQMEETKQGYDLYTRNINTAEKLTRLQMEYRNTTEQEQVTIQKNSEVQTQLNKLLTTFNEAEFKEIKVKVDGLKSRITEYQTLSKSKHERYDQIDADLLEIDAIQQQMKEIQVELAKIRQMSQFCGNLRDWYRFAGPKILENLMKKINYQATMIYRDLTGKTDLELNWRSEDYIVELITSAPHTVREFVQLSGGEQMAVALAIRLALLQTISKVDFAFFDEPTNNLDGDKKANLANQIKNIKGFKQFFLISHDNTFEDEAHHVVHFTIENDKTKINYN